MLGVYLMGSELEKIITIVMMKYGVDILKLDFSKPGFGAGVKKL